MNSSPVYFHSILLTAHHKEVQENHRAYCSTYGYRHLTHVIASPDNGCRTLLLYKYSLVRKILSSAPADAILVFSDESAAVYAPLSIPDVIGNAEYWFAQCAFHHRPDGSFFILRAGAQALRMVDDILDRMRNISDRMANRWMHAELEGISAHPHDQLIGERHRAILLFTPFGHHLPELSAFVLSFNPTVHENTYDARLVAIFIGYLNQVRARNGKLFDDIDSIQTTQSAYEVINPGKSVALITSYTPNIRRYAAISEANITAYCLHHGYSHHIYRDLPTDMREAVAGNWVKAALLLNHFDEHEQVVWVDADILIHDLTRPLESIVQGNPVTFARDISGHAFNSGFMAFSNTPMCRAYLERVQSLIEAVLDKSGVYASGGDQRFFIEAWQEAGGAAVMPLSDCVSFNSHPALYDADTFMLHYMGYPDRFRVIVMRSDVQRIEQKTATARISREQSVFIPTEGRHGKFFVNRHDTHVGRSLEMYGEWSEPKIALFGQIVGAGDTVIEAGANLGSHTVWLSRKVTGAGAVIAFEPERHVFHLLCTNLVINACTNVTTLQKAVGAEVGEVAFPLLDPHQERNFGSASLKWHWTDKTERVHCTTLDALCLERLDFIKVDVEGCELELLDGATNAIARHRPVVYVEIGSREIRNAVVDKFNQLDYSCWYYITPLFTQDNWRGLEQDVLNGYAVDMVCVPNERFEVAGMLRAAVDDDIVKYLDGQIQWATLDWRLARITRRKLAAE
ncbi:methyltransferase, FkbM family domain protein [Collimonas arenae]|uniref:Methyltransferase, FkbM family domain protein n=1 Tax=Collimonas arenae TaxID=279058 RepID=A0A127QJ89_9BURK|nr:FkbM family methyltransferase [Collimonas arenae]AMP10084.1 methyltransferase, FkbM family domain protein [Collimonas arenae]